MGNANTLFDIFCKNDSQRCKLEKDKLLSMNCTRFAFYKDQKEARIGKCTSILQKLDRSDLTFNKKALQQGLTKNKDQRPVTKCTIIEGKTSTSSHNTVASETETAGKSLFEMPFTSNQKQFLEQNRRALKEVAMVREQCGISDRAGAAVATATLKAFEIVTESESK